MAEAITEKRIAYLKSSNFLRWWSERECEVCEVEGVGLSMARAAPPLRHARPVEAPDRAVKEVPALRKKVPDDPYLNLLVAAVKATHAVADLSAWWNRAPAPRPPVRAEVLSSPSVPAPMVRKVPPFDIQDVPKAMRKLHMPMAARLQERWFAGQENYSLTNDDLRDELNQIGAPYAPAMVDSTTIKMDWVLSFPRAKRAFDELIQNQLQTLEALKILKVKLMPYRKSREIIGWNIAKSDYLEFHKKFQFQRIAVNATWSQRIEEFLVRMVADGGVPDDLTAALGAFNLYVAVRYAHVDRATGCAIVTDVSVYVRDPYEFSTEQYLGHWSPSHVAIVPAHHLTASSGWLNYPVLDGNIHYKDAVLYPVTNKSYRDWRLQHRQGGDFMIYTDRANVRLNPPIRVML